MGQVIYAEHRFLERKKAAEKQRPKKVTAEQILAIMRKGSKK